MRPAADTPMPGRWSTSATTGPRAIATASSCAISRAVAGQLAPTTHDGLRTILRENPDVTRQLRALWALHVTGGLNAEQILGLLESQQEALRAWAVQLGLEEHQASTALLRQLAARAE